MSKKASLKDIILEVNEKESKEVKEQEQKFLNKMVELEEKRMKVEDEREERREKAETLMFERHMEVLMQMQMINALKNSQQ